MQKRVKVHSSVTGGLRGPCRSGAPGAQLPTRLAAPPTARRPSATPGRQWLPCWLAPEMHRPPDCKRPVDACPPAFGRVPPASMRVEG